jgi:hypothetical protein
VGWSFSFFVVFIGNRVLIVLKDGRSLFFPNDFFNFVASYVSFQPNLLLTRVYYVVISFVNKWSPVTIFKDEFELRAPVCITSSSFL